jgi:hypothetical protein
MEPIIPGKALPPVIIAREGPMSIDAFEYMARGDPLMAGTFIAED